MQKPEMQFDVRFTRDLQAQIRGRVIEPAMPDYDEARRVFYAGFDRRPLAVVRVADAADVARAVVLARDAGVPIAIRNGGHSPAGHSTIDNGIVIDLSAMRGLDIDAATRSAWADAGLTTGEYTTAVGAHGLATGFGDAGSVGIAGITLSGGIGFLHRKYGLTIDSVLAADIVTARGDLLRVDKDSHPELFWAIRGGGGNFGVVTRICYRLHEVGTVLSGLLVFAASPETIPALIAAACESSDALSGLLAVMPAPPMPFFPPDLHGRMIVMMSFAHCGSADEAEREIARLRSIAAPLVDMVHRIPYSEIYNGGSPPQPPKIAVHPTFIDDIDRVAAERIIDALQRSRAQVRVVQFRILGGAVARVPRGATAFAHRDRRMLAIIAATCADAAEHAEHQAWANGCAAHLRQGEPGTYVGFLGEDGKARVRDAYPAKTWERLVAIKAAHDPANLFRMNQNIAPGG